MVSFASLRVPLAIAAALTLLFGGAALTGQVQDDLETTIETQDLLDDLKVKPPVELINKLDLSDLEIPEDLDVTLPPGTTISPDLSQIKLDSPLDVKLPDDFPLEDLLMGLPKDFDLDLPAGSVLDPRGLTLPNGARIRLPDGSSFDVPPGARLDLPPEVVQQLLQKGLRYGTLPTDRSLSLSDLPQGLSGKLDLPTLPGGGTLTLPAGTTIKLPNGHNLPLSPGLLDAFQKIRLPAGTTFDWPRILGGAAGAIAGGAGGGSGSYPGFRGGGAAPPEACPGCIAPETVITSEYPTKIRKGEPFRVSGYVKSGAPTAGVPIAIYINETKDTPGRLVGTTHTDARGMWHADVTLPKDLPAADYQLVARSAPYTGADGAPRGEGWSDPPISFEAATRLTLFVPPQDGLGARVPVTGTLKDDVDAPVAGELVSVYADGALAARVTTDEDGAWSASVTFGSAGTHRVRARFAGTEHLDASEASGAVRIIDGALDVPARVSVNRGESILLAGRVLESGSAKSGASVTLSVLGSTLSATTGTTGEFAMNLRVPTDAEPGDYAATYEVPALSLRKEVEVRVLVTGRFEVDAPEFAATGTPAEAYVRFVPESGGPITLAAPFEGTASGPGGVAPLVGVAGARAEWTRVLLHAPSDAAGKTTFTFASSMPLLQAKPLEVIVLFGTASIAWDLPDYAIRGDETTLAGTVYLDGKPRPATVRLGYFGDHVAVAGPDGRFEAAVKVPADAPLGPRTLTAAVTDLGHETREELPVKARTRLAIDAPERWSPDAALVANVTLTDDRGEPLRGAKISGGWSARAADGVGATVGLMSLTPTDARGRAEQRLDPPPFTEAVPVELTARFHGDDRYLPSQTSAEVAEPLRDGTVGVSGIPVKTVALGGGAVLLLAAAVVAAPFALKRLRRGPAAAAPKAALGVVRSRRGLRVDLGIDPDLPPVLGVGETLVARAERPALWAWGGASVGDGASEEVRVRLDREGDAVLEADAGDAAARVAIRVVEYRREIAREFDQLLEAAAPIAPGLTSRASAREVEAALLPFTPEAARRKLDDAVSVLEYASYSHHPIDREHYVRFYRSATALAAALRERSAARAPPRDAGGPGKVNAPG